MLKATAFVSFAIASLVVTGASAQVSSPANTPTASTTAAPPQGGEAPLPPEGSVAEPSSQHARRHDGFYFRLGLGPSYVALRGDGHGSETEGPGIGEMIAFGATPATGLVIAGSASFQSASAKVVESSGVVSGIGTLATGNYGVLVDWFPDPGAGWHIGSLLGLAFLALGDGRGYTAGASLIAGYDAWIGAEWSAGGEVVAMSALSSTSHDSTGATPDSAFVPLSLAIEATILCH